jgi:hypothetical protein
MLSAMSLRVVATVSLCVCVLCAAGCGSAGRKPTVASTTATSPILSLRLCLRHHGYAISPEPVSDIATAPRRFKFFAIWNVLNPSRVALALTFSRDTAGAVAAATWTRRENAALDRGAVAAPVVRFGKVDVLWTAQPGVHDAAGVYPCVRQHPA